jgi:hypothetical protein
MVKYCQSQWPHSLRHELSSLAPTLGSWVRIPLRTWMFGVCMRLFCVCVVLCLGRGLAAGWSLVQRVLPSVKKNYYGTEIETWALNGPEETSRKKDNEILMFTKLYRNEKVLQGSLYDSWHHLLWTALYRGSCMIRSRICLTCLLWNDMRPSLSFVTFCWTSYWKPNPLIIMKS